MDACRPGDTLVKKPDLEPYEITWEPPNPTTSDSITITNWGSEGTADSEFYYPRGIAVGNSNNVYVVDTHNNRTQKFDSSGKYITKWGKYGTGDRAFNRPYDVAVDSGGNVYVADTFNHRIQKFAPDIPGVFPTLFYPIIYDNNWNADTWGYTDTTTWTIGKDTLYYSNRHGYVLVKQIVIWYEWDSGEESVSYVIEKDGVEFRKGDFIKGPCHPIPRHLPQEWCRGSDTLDIVFPAGTYVLKLSKPKQGQNKWSNDNGYVRLFGSAVKGTGFDDTIALSDGQTLSGDRDKDEEVYYRFYLSAGQRATVTLQPLEGDQDLYIFNPKRHPIEVSGNSGTETEKCTVTADTSGYYYAKVHGFAAGRYTITLSI